jgi:putative ABC transport system permease protein
MLRRLVEDLRFSGRTLTQAPAFAAIAILTLALAIGANTAIFSIANALLFRPLPYQDPDRLVVVTNAHGVNRRPFSYIRARFIQDHSRTISGLAPFASENFNLTGRGNPELLASARVAWNFFDVLGVYPSLGRVFHAEEDRPGAAPVAIISDSLWKRRFGADPGVLGQFLTLDSVPTAVIGVMPPDFEFSPLGRSVDVWSTRIFETNSITPQQARNGAAYLIAIARLDVPLDQAQAEMRVLDAQYERENPGLPDADTARNISLNAVQDLMVAPVRSAVLLLFAAVSCVLLIACANVASLLLSRAVSRRKEIAIRSALGATPASLVRQLLTESISLALMGGALGTALSALGLRIISSLPPNTLPRINPIRIDLRVLAFTLAASLLTGILFGLIPALQLARTDVQSALGDESRSSTGGRWRNLTRGLLVVCQIAVSMMLLIGAGLLMRSFVQLEHVPLGFNPDRVLLMNITLTPVRYANNAQAAEFFHRVLEQAARTPGVRSVAAASALPLGPWSYSAVLPEGQPQLPIPQRPLLSVQAISPDYFESMGIPLLQGRAFTEREKADSPTVAIVNQVMAQRYWPDEDPIGKHLVLGNSIKPLEIVGVVGNVKNITLAVISTPEIYYPIAQRPPHSISLIVRCALNPLSLASAVRAAILAIDSDQPVTDVRTMEQHIAGSVSQTRLTMVLLVVFSAVALAVAMVGLYGLIAYSVAQRTRELGIRLALGAAPGKVVRLVMRQGLLLAILGVLLGLGGSLALTHLMQSLLYDVSATDVWTFTVCAGCFVLIALAASYVPARRAAQLDPTDAMRSE